MQRPVKWQIFQLKIARALRLRRTVLRTDLRESAGDRPVGHLGRRARVPSEAPAAAVRGAPGRARPCHRARAGGGAPQGVAVIHEGGWGESEVNFGVYLVVVFLSF